MLNADFDYVRYLDELHAHGLNNTRTFVGSYREIPGSFGIADNTLAPRPNRYLCPWARSSTPGYFDGGNKFDLNRWDDAFFKRLRDFLAQASRRGIVVEVNFFTPNYDDKLWQANPMNAGNNVNGVGKCPSKEVYTLRHKDLVAVHEALVRKIVRELKDFDNLYYEVCNEPYFGGVTTEWQHRILDAIVAEEKDFPHRHLISLNIANGRAKVTRPHPAVSLFNFHYCHPPDVVALNRHLNKPIGENETGFRGKVDVLYRTEGWDFILAGGALYNNLDYSFTTKFRFRRSWAIIRGIIIFFWGAPAPRLLSLKRRLMSRFLGCVSNKRSVESRISLLGWQNRSASRRIFWWGCLPEVPPQKRLPSCAAAVYSACRRRTAPSSADTTADQGSVPTDAPLGDTRLPPGCTTITTRAAVRSTALGNRLAASSSPSSCLPFSKVTSIAHRAE